MINCDKHQLQVLRSEYAQRTATLANESAIKPTPMRNENFHSLSAINVLDGQAQLLIKTTSFLGK